MKYIKFFSGLFRLCLFAIVLSVLFNFNPLAVAAVLIIASAIIPMPKQSAFGTILEVWANYIIERFWKDNPFLKQAYDDSDYVVQGRIVHIPQPGSKPNVVKNRNVYPATAVRRTDTDVLYSLDEYSTDPTHIPNIDSIHISYSKQDSVLGDHMQVLDETVADDMLIKWGGNATFFATTGGAAAGTVPPTAGQVGTRKGFHHTDLQKLMILMNVDNVPKQDRHILIDDNMFDFFYSSLSDTQQRDFSRYMDASNGVIGKLHGFEIHTRSSVLGATNANAVKALGAAMAGTDNLCSLAWHKNSIAFAIGTKNLYQDLNNPLYYGDVHSASMMAGGRVRRGDDKGVYVVTQGV